MCFQIDFSNNVNKTVDSDLHVTSFNKFKTIQPTEIVIGTQKRVCIEIIAIN